MNINSASHRNPAKSSYPLPPKKKRLSTGHALNTARIAPRPPPQRPDGLHLQNLQLLLERRAYEEIWSKTDEKITIITINTRLLFGEWGVPAG